MRMSLAPRCAAVGSCTCSAACQQWCFSCLLAVHRSAASPFCCTLTSCRTSSSWGTRCSFQVNECCLLPCSCSREHGVSAKQACPAAAPHVCPAPRVCKATHMCNVDTLNNRLSIHKKKLQTWTSSSFKTPLSTCTATAMWKG